MPPVLPAIAQREAEPEGLLQLQLVVARGTGVLVVTATDHHARRRERRRPVHQQQVGQPGTGVDERLEHTVHGAVLGADDLDDHEHLLPVHDGAGLVRALGRPHHDEVGHEHAIRAHPQGHRPHDAQAVRERAFQRGAGAGDRALGVGRGTGSDHERAVDQLRPAFTECLLDARLDFGPDQRAVVRLAPRACVRRRRPGACVFAFDVVHSHLRCSSVGHRATVTGPTLLRDTLSPEWAAAWGRAGMWPCARCCPAPIPSNSPRTTPTRRTSARRTSASTSWRARTGRSPSTAAPRAWAATSTARCSAPSGSSPRSCWWVQAPCAPRTTAAPASPPGVGPPRRRSRSSPARPTSTRAPAPSPTPASRRPCPPAPTRPPTGCTRCGRRAPTWWCSTRCPPPPSSTSSAAAACTACSARAGRGSSATSWPPTSSTSSASPSPRCS